ncbi:hypothetical protein ACFRCG_25490 [Embleya sp. NPDC056575]
MTCATRLAQELSVRPATGLSVRFRTLLSKRPSMQLSLKNMNWSGT